jgi:hypothetical protein
MNTTLDEITDVVSDDNVSRSDSDSISGKHI